MSSTSTPRPSGQNGHDTTQAPHAAHAAHAALTSVQCSPDQLHSLFSQHGHTIPADLHLIRQGTHIVLGSHQQGLVWRLSSHVTAETIHHNLNVSTTLANREAPVLGPATDTIAIDGTHCMTEWPYADPIPPDQAHPGLGHCLAGLHAHTPVETLPPFGDFTKIPARLRRAAAAGVPTHLLAAMERRAEEVLPAMQTLIATDRTLLHGDALPTNLVLHHGRPTLIDLDDLSTGPAQLDLIPVWVTAHRTNTTANYQACAAAYGHDISGWHGLDVAGRFRELTMITWLAALQRSTTTARDELQHRISTWDLPVGTHAPWTQH